MAFLLETEKSLRNLNGRPPFDKDVTSMKALVTVPLIKHILPSFIRRLEGLPPKNIRFVDTAKDRRGTTFADVLSENLPTILIILMGINQDQRIFELAEAGYTDESLPFREEDLSRIFGPKAYGIRKKFEEAQVTWFRSDEILNPLVHHVFSPSDPPPFTFHGSMGRGGEGLVTTVEYRKGEVYIRKQLIGKDSSRIPTEVLNMRKLGKSKHCTELITSYLYEGVISLILTPVGVCTLHEYLQKPAKFFLERAGRDRGLMMADWLLCMAEGLRHLHRNNMVHCDLKPLNVFLRKDSTVLLGDFGVSRQFEEASEITGMRQFRNSEYRAPECLSHSGKASRSSDIFSLGCIYLDVLNILLGGSMSRFREKRKLQGAAKGRFSNHIDMGGTAVSAKAFAGREQQISTYFEKLFAEKQPKKEVLKLFELATEMMNADRSKRPDIMRVMHTAFDLISAGFGKPHCGLPATHHEPKPEIEDVEDDDTSEDDTEPDSLDIEGISA
jgi:serine/threonine protein kinase